MLTKSSFTFDRLYGFSRNVRNAVSRTWKGIKRHAVNDPSTDIILRLKAAAQELGMPMPIILQKSVVKDVIFNCDDVGVEQINTFREKLKEFLPLNSSFRSGLEFEQQAGNGIFHDTLTAFAVDFFVHLSMNKNKYVKVYDVPFLILEDKETHFGKTHALSYEDVVWHEFTHHTQSSALQNIKGFNGSLVKLSAEERDAVFQDKEITPKMIAYCRDRQIRELHADTVYMFKKCQEGRLNDLGTSLRHRTENFSLLMKKNIQQNKKKTETVLSIASYACLPGALKLEKFIGDVLDKNWEMVGASLDDVFNCNSEYVPPITVSAKNIFKKIKKRGLQALDFKEISHMAAALTAKYCMTDVQFAYLHDYIREVSFCRRESFEDFPDQKSGEADKTVFWKEFGHAYHLGMKPVESKDVKNITENGVSIGPKKPEFKQRRCSVGCKPSLSGST